MTSRLYGRPRERKSQTHTEHGNMEAELHALRRGDLKFAEFVNLTRGEWMKMAAYLLRRWKAPASVAAEDLVQEMLLQTWEDRDRWDGRGSIQGYMKQRAYRRAKRHLHRHRQVPLNNGDRQPGRFAITGVELDRQAVDPPDTSPILDAQKLPETRAEALVLDAMLRELDLDRAVERLIDDRASRLVLGFKNRTTAKRAARKTLSELAERVI